ncbi:hypothetical protein I0Q91_05570 [Halanaerobiaceae bacterium Z-7014]|uniref:Uncharacterized protein n=1 Tax=Halonatronomonas betaini TaxID=2778430 RepID=A0A931ARI5_9FIRM|nr:hypothetical protein [Halonatronomonas betaini]
MPGTWIGVASGVYLYINNAKKPGYYVLLVWFDVYIDERGFKLDLGRLGDCKKGYKLDV